MAGTAEPLTERAPILPTAEEFGALLDTEEPEGLVQRYLLGEGSFVFRSNPDAFDRLRRKVARELSVAEEAVVLVGSAKLGFSLAPYKYPAAFSEDSDLDVAVMSERHFDFFWHTIRNWGYPRRQVRLPQGEKNWFRDRREDVFWGWLYPTEVRYDGLSFPETLKPLRDESARWFRAFQSLSLDEDLAKWRIVPRLYRGPEHLIAYHAAGLRSLRALVLSRGEQ